MIRPSEIPKPERVAPGPRELALWFEQSFDERLVGFESTDGLSAIDPAVGDLQMAAQAIEKAQFTPEMADRARSWPASAKLEAFSFPARGEGVAPFNFAEAGTRRSTPPIVVAVPGCGRVERESPANDAAAA